jgi:hypothetical protein
MKLLCCKHSAVLETSSQNYPSILVSKHDARRGVEQAIKGSKITASHEFFNPNPTQQLLPLLSLWLQATQKRRRSFRLGRVSTCPLSPLRENHRTAPLKLGAGCLGRMLDSNVQKSCPLGRQLVELGRHKLCFVDVCELDEV